MASAQSSDGSAQSSNSSAQSSNSSAQSSNSSAQQASTKQSQAATLQGQSSTIRSQAVAISSSTNLRAEGIQDILSGSLGASTSVVTLPNVIATGSGTIAGWTIDSDAIFVGTKDTNGFTSGNGHLTISSTGAIHGPKFFMNSSGDLQLEGTVTATAGAIGGFTLSNNNLKTGDFVISGSGDGSIKTAESGRRVEIDGTDNSLTFHSGSGGVTAMELSDQNASYAIILGFLSGNIKQPGIKLSNFGGISVQVPSYTSGMDRPMFGLQMTKPYSTFSVGNSSTLHDSDWVGTGITHPGPVGAYNFSKGMQIGHVVHLQNSGGPTMGFYADLNSNGIGSNEVHAFRGQLGGFHPSIENYSTLTSAGHRNDAGTVYGMEIELESNLRVKSGSYGIKISNDQDSNGAAGQYDYLMHTDFGSSYQQGNHISVGLQQNNTAGVQAFGIVQSGIVYNTFTGTSTFPKVTVSDSLVLGATDKLYFDGSHNGNTYIHEASADALHFVIGGSTILELDENGSAANNWMAIQATNKFYLDGGSNTYIQEISSDNIRFVAGNVGALNLSSTGGTFYGDLTVADDLFVNDFARIDALRVGTTATDPGDGKIYAEDSITTAANLFVQGYARIDGLRVGTSGFGPGDNDAAIAGDLTVGGNIYINGITDAAGLPKFFVRRTSDTSALSSNTWTTIVYNSEDFDTGSDFNTSNGIFSAPASGYYHFAWQNRFNSIQSTADYIWTKLVCSDHDVFTNIIPIDDFANTTQAYWQGGGSCTVHMDSGDTAKIQCYVRNGTNTTIDGSSSNYQSWFSCHMVI